MIESIRNKAAAVLAVTTLAVVGMASAAGAQTPTAVEAAFTEVEGEVTSMATLGLGLAVVAIVASIGVRLLVKWVRRGVGAA